MLMIKNALSDTVERLRRALSGGVAADSIILVFVKCLVAVVRVVQTMILSRALTKSEYGTYSQALLIISLFSPIFSLGLDSAVSYFFNRAGDEGEKREWVETIFGISTAAGVLGAVLLMVFRDSVSAYYRNAAIAGLMVWISLRPCLQNLASAYQNLYVSSGLSKAVAVRNALVAAAQVAAVAVATLLIRDLAVLFALLLVLDVLQLLFFSGYYRASRFPIHPWRLRLDRIRPIMGYAVPMLLASSVSTLSLNLGRILVSGLMSLEDFALFTNMSQELPFSFMISSFTAVVTPAVVRLLATGNRASFERLWGDYLELGYLITWPLCAAATVVAPQMIEFLYSDAYLTPDGVAVFRVCMFMCALRFTYFGLVPTAMGKSGVVLRYSVLSLALSLPLTAVLHYALGMGGAAMASVASTVISGVLYFRKSAQLTGVNIASVVRLRRSLVLGLEMLALGLVALLASTLLNTTPLITVAMGFVLVAGGCYVLNAREITGILRSMNENRL